MEARSVRGVERVLAKLDDCITTENYYEALQMYRTLYYRYQAQKKYTALMELLKSGAELFLDRNQLRSGADLAILYVNVLKEASVAPAEDNFNVLGNWFSRMTPDMREREVFANNALTWSKKEGDSNKGHTSLHRSFAQTYWKEKNYEMARYHFLHSTDGKGCASMLIELHTHRGFPAEVDLFIAQAVLQYLCLRNKSTATVAFNSYTTRHPNIQTGPPYLLPLLNFIWFLLKAIENGELVVFTVLCERYQPSIQRDPAYPEYLGKIGQIFFGATQPQIRNQGIFGNFFQSFGAMFNDESDSEEGGVSTGSAAATGSSMHKSNLKMETEDVD